MPGVVHQTRIAIPGMMFGHGHTSYAAGYTATGAPGMAGWRMDTNVDTHLGLAFPPIGLQDPSTNYPGSPKDMEMFSVELFYFASGTDSTNELDFEYGLQGKAVTEVLSTTRPEVFTDIPNGTALDLERVVDTLATPIALDTDDWGGIIFGRLGATGANETANPNTSNIHMAAFIINLRPV